MHVFCVIPPLEEADRFGDGDIIYAVYATEELAQQAIKAEAEQEASSYEFENDHEREEFIDNEIDRWKIEEFAVHGI